MSEAPGPLRRWVLAARPRTLPAATVPVVIGTLLVRPATIDWPNALLCLLIALSLQVATNYANDYSDGVRGADAVRVGPVRLVASGLAPASAVKRAAFLSFAVAAVAGLFLALATSPYLIAVGAACVAAGWFYTGGPRPYGYAGLGEAFVFVFFGLVAVVGTAYVSLQKVSTLAIVAAVPVGLIAVALLVVNNLRDLDNDARAGKKTLAVRLGGGRTRAMYEACIVAAFLGVVAVAYYRRGALVALAAALFGAGPVLKVHRGAADGDLIGVLQMTSRLDIVLGLLLAIGIAL